MKTIYILEKEDVREKTELRGFDLLDAIDEAVDALKEFADNSIYDDSSEGYCYEDNISFLETQKHDLLRTLKVTQNRSGAKDAVEICSKPSITSRS